MRIDPSIKSTPFANVKDVSYFKGEDEFLFSMHPVFRIGQMKKLVGTDPIWEVELTLISDDDSDLRALTKQMQEETKGSTGWFRLGKLLIQLAQFNKAEELYELLLKQTNDQNGKGDLLQQLGEIKDDQGKYAKALEYYEKSLEIKKKTLPADHPELAISYNNIGSVYDNMGKYSKALDYYEKSLEISKKTLPVNHPELATTYNNVGLVYHNMGEYSKALEYYEKDLEISKKTLPANHPSLATTYNNIGWVYRTMADYKKALEYYERGLDIWTCSLPRNHPGIKNVKDSIEFVRKKL